ncbi:hypothetical protein FB451DRAFT_1263181 [Mycena latifolia]|nr:hypothetical protein FB451DRAFT_1263181 [Mycena latifolia]
MKLIEAYADTNDPPSDVDRLHISQLLDEETIAVASLDNKIDQLRAQLVDLRSLRRKRRKTIEKLRAITSPLRHLPPEILSLIVMQCPRAGDQDQVLRNPDPHVAPLLLVRICSRWRHIALATPMLWTDSLQAPLTKLRWPIILMNNWVVNAAPLPISLAARCYSSEVLKQALTVTSRFKALHLQLSTRSIYALRDRIPRELHIDVENLRINIQYHKADPFPRHSASRWCPPRRLTPALLKFCLPWTQLTHLRVDEPLYFDSMTVLVQCINLIGCTFGTLASFDDDEDVGIHERTTFPFLADANFSFDLLDSDTAGNFFAPLILPALKKLVLQSTLYHPIVWSNTAFNSFQMQSAFTLETLELHVLITTEDLGRLLGNLPTLKSFTLTEIANPEALFSLLTSDGTNSLLPQLERLGFSFVQSDASLEPFITMIRSRRERARATAAGTPATSRLEQLHLISAKATLPIDRWWWQWKLEKVFPKMELEFECKGSL